MHKNNIIHSFMTDLMDSYRYGLEVMTFPFMSPVINDIMALLLKHKGHGPRAL